MSTFKHQLVTYVEQSIGVLKINHTNFFFDTQITSAIEAICLFSTLFEELVPDP